MIGQTLGHYRILDKLGEGGMGVVYRAEDSTLKRQVALKVLPVEFASDQQRLERFQREAETLAALDHPNIVTVFTVEVEEDIHFLTMELVEGKQLSELIPGGGMPLERFLEIAIPLADALAAAHEQGVIHRDIKPANILITNRRGAKVLDFGLAKMTANETPSDTEMPTALAEQDITTPGTALGTIAYMSPEQVRGEPLEAGTDLFSLGVVLYQMATGSQPFPGNTTGVVFDQILNRPAVAPLQLNPSLPPELEHILDKLLEKDPRVRYQAASDLLVDLRRLERSTTSAGVVTGVAHTHSESHSELDSPGPTPTSSSNRSGPQVPWGGLQRWWPLAALALVLAVVVALWITRRDLRSIDPSPSQATAPEDISDQRKRTVVLPFENLGAAEDAYFAAGVTEEITRRLAMVEGLAVISRKSAVSYAGSDKTITQIGDELRVDYVLEGTVLWAKGPEGSSRVRITPQLIRVADDTHMWAQAYERSVEDIFAIQSDIAEQVIGEMGFTLLEPERHSLEERPTENLDAYQAYLQGLSFMGRVSPTRQILDQAARSFERAIDLDRDFAAAYAWLCRTHSLTVISGLDVSEERRERAKNALDRAIELAPDAFDTRLAEGYYHYQVRRAYDRALEAFVAAEAAQPGGAEVPEARAYILRRQGRWDESMAQFDTAVGLNPRDANLLPQVAVSLVHLGQFERAAEITDQVIGLAPDEPWSYGLKAWSRQFAGDLEEARSALQAMPPSADPRLLELWVLQELYEEEYREALARLAAIPGEWISDQAADWPKPLRAAMIEELLGETERARDDYTTAAAVLEAEFEVRPDDVRLLPMLAYANSGLGHDDEALEWARQAAERTPVSRDALRGNDYLVHLAFIQMRSGEIDAAIEQLDDVLSRPCATLSMPILRVSPLWAPVQTHPRFQELLEKYEHDAG